MHQILFRIPGINFQIYTYGVMMSIAFGAALIIAMRRAHAQGISPQSIADLCVWLLVAGVVGSRLLFVLETWGDYAHRPWEILNVREGGLSIHGGLIFGALVGWWFVRSRKLDFWKTADLLAPSIAIGMGIGRIGCFFNGCCLGIITRLPIGVVFKDVPEFPGPRYPTQLFEMAANFAIAGLLVTVFKKSKPGIAFLWLGILAAGERFFMEFIRADAVPAGPLSVAQWICLGIVVVCAALIARFQRTNEKAPELQTSLRPS